LTKQNDTQSVRKKSLASVRAYKDAFATSDGKKVLWDLMKEVGFNTTNFCPCPYTTAHNEGARGVVLHILKRMNIDEKRLESMIKQGETEDEQDQQDYL